MAWDPLFTYVLGGLAACVVALVVYQRAADRRRREAYERFCLERGLAFRREQPGEEQRHAGTCPLLAQGHARHWRYTISGTRNDVPFSAFEYQWTTGGGKSAHTHRIAAVLWTLEREAELPQFTLTPEGSGRESRHSLAGRISISTTPPS